MDLLTLSLFPAQRPKIDAKLRTARMVISTNSPDHAGHIVDPTGGNYIAYQANPIVMWNHEGFTDPTKVIGKALKISPDYGQVIATIEYDDSPLAQAIFDLECKGLLPGVSIGIIPTVTRELNGLKYIDKWTLIEISKVAAGTNPGALTIRP